jgi:mannose/fructose/N-acetylgalactosamine-specific phosphotransferase system component IID
MEQNSRTLKHSGLGIASFIISLAMGICVFFLLVIAGIMEVSTPGGMDEESPAAVIIGLFIIAALIVTLIGIGFGIAGLIQKNRNKNFSILGVIFNTLITLGVIVIMTIGIFMG